MNSNLNRALSAALVAFGGVVSAVAQVDADYICVDPNNTKPYSDDYRVQQKSNDLFGANIGLSGTKAYLSDAQKAGCNGGGPIAGRIGFFLGDRGSFQDEDPNQAGSFVDTLTGRPITDNLLLLTKGVNPGVTTGSSYVPPSLYNGLYFGPGAGGSSFARIYVQQGATAPTNYLFGGTGFNLFYSGASGRFIVAEATVDGTAANNSVDVLLNLEVIGDAARLNWRLTNNLTTTDTVALGLYFAQDIQLYTRPQGVAGPVLQVVPYSDTTTVFTTIPGRRPLTVEERFNRSGLGPNGEAEGATVGVPPYVSFSMNQAAGFGLQVVNSPSALTGFDPNSGLDQTPVDEFVFGDPNTLFDGRFSATDPQIGDFIFNPAGAGNSDAASVSPQPGYVQKWLPSGVARGAARNIIAYYRSTNGDSSYSTAFNGYSAVVDTPKAISTDPAKITSDQPFRSNRYTIRVNVDNTGGYSNTGTEVTLQSVKVTLNLPAGITDADTGNRTITKTISSINPRQIAFTDFQFAVDPNVFGPQTYTVTISPNPKIGDKTITGVINVAAAPRLLIRQNANLVSPPFTFTDSSWEAILSTVDSPQKLNQTFQAFTWDALRQQYVPQVSAERSRGTFIVSTGDLGYRALATTGGNTARQPNDEFPSPGNYDVAPNGGAPILRLQPGWNLVGNPYNYSFPINQIIGAPVGGSQSVRFSDLIAQGYTDGTFQYYDQDGKQYLPISNSTSSDPRILPNFGYWIYANFAFDLQFPPIYEPFARASAPKIDAPQTAKDWKLQLSAATTNSRDTQNFVGVASAVEAKSVRKAPMQPSVAKGDVLYTYISGDGGAAMAQSLRRTTGNQTFTYNVFTKNGGPVTVSWPNLAVLPSGFKVTFSDNATKKSVNPRDTSGYTFTAKAATINSFTVTVAPQAPNPERITSASFASVRIGKGLGAKLSFVTTAKGTALIHLFRGGSDLGAIATGLNVAAGQNSMLWPYTDGSGKALSNGNYSVVFEVTGEDGDVATRTLAVTIRR